MYNAKDKKIETSDTHIVRKQDAQTLLRIVIIIKLIRKWRISLNICVKRLLFIVARRTYAVDNIIIINILK